MADDRTGSRDAIKILDPNLRLAEYHAVVEEVKASTSAASDKSTIYGLTGVIIN
jgi:hypothetical protein